MTFHVETNGPRFRATFPSMAYAPDAVERALDELPASVRSAADFAAPSGFLELEGPPLAVRKAATDFFARVNGYPVFRDGLLRDFRNSEQPLVSCIVLLPFNELFARNVILPGIIASSGPHPIEIILVFAGFGIDRRPFAHLQHVESELTSIARGYNAGVRAARGEYIALFHDDCYIDDPVWIEKCVDALRDDVICVTAERDNWQKVPVGKAVPLFMRRDDFRALGGYDEYYYAGVEDMDLTVAILASGKRQAQVDLRYRHLRGMGTSLVVHEQPHQLKLLFGYQLLPPETIAHVHRDMMQRLLASGFVRMLEGDYHLHFLDKFGDFLAANYDVDVPHMRHAYALMRYPYLLSPEIAYISNREKLVAAYRSLMNVAELECPLEDDAA